MTDSQLALEIKLGSLDDGERREALVALAGLLDEGGAALTPELPLVNLHSHTFYSFNAYGYSPSGLAWEAKKRGLYALGIMDHEGLLGVEELLGACDKLGLRGVGGIETRVFIPEWKDSDINMPGEPGVFGFLGCGFVSATPPPGSHAARLLDRMMSEARARLDALIVKLNALLPDLALDYESELRPTLPDGGLATERHVLRVLEAKVRALHPDAEARTRFWSDAMGVAVDVVRPLIDRAGDLQMLIRSKLMKKGGPCYVPADSTSLPTLAESVQMMTAMGAVPVAGWLDGMSEGERDTGRLLDLMLEHNVPAVSVIPDRNWNIADPAVRDAKVAKLHELAREARRRDMLLVVGTDMSKAGQKFVDDFTADALKPLVDDFLRCARIMVGHTRLRTRDGQGLLSEETLARFKGDNTARFAMFEAMGALPPPGTDADRAALDAQIEKLWQKAV